ncbi:MAG: ABC transporter ATP-binding protein [Eubacterium sp.]|nr:ABC transporter ATP-binding protein [Eubacterium sp.]
MELEKILGTDGEAGHETQAGAGQHAKPVILVEGVCKKFKVFEDKGSSLKERILFQKRRRHKERWVLKGISFTVNRGEAVGLIGKNGCGKSTVLKMLARIMYPTKGLIRMQGRVSSLIELGAGFHPDLSGRENIFTNASIFGLGRAEIERRMDEVIRFSELEEFIDDPVRTYSSGMYMRLAFAVAVHVDADILLVDEILAVGDVSFQAKCFEKIKDIKAKGTTVVIVSHVLGQVQEICDRVFWIEDGVVRQEGPPKETVDLYLAAMEQRRLQKIRQDFGQVARQRQSRHLPGFCMEGAVRKGSMEVYFTGAMIRDGKGQQEVVFQTGEQMEICLCYHAKQEGAKINFTINIARDDGVYCFGTSALSGMYDRSGITAEKEGMVSMLITGNHLLKGRYLVDIGIQDMQEHTYDLIQNAMEFWVEGREHGQRGIVYLPSYWKMNGQKLEDQFGG